ncbi:hypothetical protein [Pyruvatibacter sp.]|uniref:hypothetical protein n=1 Tax=Pyruvatibacter sp. TaxID=1981328 RepID=UPI0032EDE410
MNDAREPHDLNTSASAQPQMAVAQSAPLADVEPLDGASSVMGDDDWTPAWYEDGGRKTALGAWAGTTVVAYGAMQVTGYFADWPFVALVAGALGYFAVRGVAVVLGEVARRADGNGRDTD